MVLIRTSPTSVVLLQRRGVIPAGARRACLRCKSKGAILERSEGSVLGRFFGHERVVEENYGSVLAISGPSSAAGLAWGGRW